MRLRTLLLAALLAGAPVSTFAQTCEGDCNGDDSVAINELILAVRIALGDASLNDCDAIDRDNDGDVGINELVAAVTRALQGCAGTIDESALVASARIAVEPIIRIIDLGGAAAGLTGGVASRAGTLVGRPAGSSGCETFECFLFGELTGTEEACCFPGELTVTSTNCLFDDEFGNVITRDGAFGLFADDPSVCSGSIPPGVSFEAFDEDFFFSYEDVNGNFLAITSNLTETFQAQPAGCTDELGFGLFGDGTRILDGGRREIVGDVFGSIVADNATSYDSLQIDVVSAAAPQGCAVGVRLDGGLMSNDFTAGTVFDATFAQFQILQAPSGDALALDVSGTIGTDCIGDVSLVTTDPLRLVPGDECITGGRLEASLDGGSVAVEYGSGGGIGLDFGIDGSIDQTFAGCDDLVSDDCNAPVVSGLCAPCTGQGQCDTGLECFECSFNCTGDTLRCASTEDFVTCEDGVF